MPIYLIEAAERKGVALISNLWVDLLHTTGCRLKAEMYPMYKEVLPWKAIDARAKKYQKALIYRSTLPLTPFVVRTIRRIKWALEADFMNRIKYWLKQGFLAEETESNINSTSMRECMAEGLTMPDPDLNSAISLTNYAMLIKCFICLLVLDFMVLFAEILLNILLKMYNRGNNRGNNRRNNRRINPMILPMKGSRIEIKMKEETN